MKIEIDLPENATGATVEVMKPKNNFIHEGFTRPAYVIKTTYHYNKKDK